MKENLNIARVFQFLSERHIESVSRWSTDDPSANDHDFSFQIGQNTNRDVRVRFAGFPDDGNNSNSHSNVNNHHSQNGKLNSGSRLRNNHNNSLTGNVNNGGIFLHKVSLLGFIYLSFDGGHNIIKAYLPGMYIFFYFFRLVA